GHAWASGWEQVKDRSNLTDGLRGRNHGGPGLRARRARPPRPSRGHTMRRSLLAVLIATLIVALALPALARARRARSRPARPPAPLTTERAEALWNRYAAAVREGRRGDALSCWSRAERTAYAWPEWRVASWQNALAIYQRLAVRIEASQVESTYVALDVRYE